MNWSELVETKMEHVNGCEKDLVSLLDSWNLSELYPILTAYGITYSHLQHIRDGDFTILLSQLTGSDKRLFGPLVELRFMVDKYIEKDCDIL